MPAAFQNTVHDSGLPEYVKNVVINNYGDFYGLQRDLEKLPHLTQAMRLKILKLLAEGSGGMLVNE